ncbi:glycine cleavage system aminomethyltransferase GcvT [Natronococcus sp. A-GB7]|uniref:glycine cleavage system aminomethyltransferase GcvT n=1 Tax=Natronococcus sp. A-GB7 TaxID=3037649 RepID=UPI0024203C97|nr:glycine cleavage system aminomethyltransferase GcvT [Natronococcus sp. A-GB7]MDG5817682.1 glycine cleavage system aminomethyltransferase GcvT [Natronococcus sp. A-GB7]
MTSRKPPLYQIHQRAGADFTDFGGWEMPVTFDSISTEHDAVRETAGCFDISHMSEVVVRGPDAAALTNRLTTNDVNKLDPGDAQYSCVLNDEGVILDDIVVYRYPDRDGYLFVPNAGHGAQMAARWEDRASALDLDVTVEDQSEGTGMIAVQGPDAVEAVESATADAVGDLSRFTAQRTEIDDVSCLVARTGYTGEDGYEIVLPAADSETVWAAFDGIQPCGLGARDTLRLEAGLLLSGQDFDLDTEPRTPLEAGLGFVVDFEKPSFVGKDALLELRENGVDERIVGLRIEERAIARQGYSITDGDDEIGHVTSGTMSPTFEVPLALGYVDTEYAAEGTQLGIEVRNRVVDATVVDQRFLNTLEADA